MGKGRLEAFSDGVIAIIITIMVLEMHAPHEATWDALRPLIPVFLAYVLSFVNVGIYWNNHHHLLHATRRVRGGTLWANLHLLFWLSLVPFTTRWMGEADLAALPVAAYGFVLLMAAVAYTILVMVLVRDHPQDSVLARAVGADYKSKLCVGLYVVAIPLAFVAPQVSCGLYVLVALIWFVPDRRIERIIHEGE